MGRLLIIDDDIEGVGIWRDYFEGRGYEVFVAHETSTGVRMARTHRPDCILLDVRFEREGDEAGYLACRKLREFYREPIIMVSAYKVDPLEKVQGLEFGATAYLEKSTSLREMESWIEAQTRTFGQQIYRVGHHGEVEVDTRQREVRRAARALQLTQTEYRLLAFLCAHRGTLVVAASADLLAGRRGRLLGLRGPNDHGGRNHESVDECHLLPLRASNESEYSGPAHVHRSGVMGCKGSAWHGLLRPPAWH